MSERIAVVTGAAQGIGRAIALDLSTDGATVVAVDWNATQLDRFAEECPSKALTVLGDVRERATLESVIEVVGDRGIWALVNNVGGSFHASATALSDRAVASLVAENFTHVFQWSTTLRPYLKPGSSVLNITSIEGHRAGPGFSVYSAMKAAVANLTATMALEYASAMIRVNAIAPDMISTPGDAELTTQSAALDASAYPTPLGRMGAPEEVAAAAAFLLSDRASFITGTTLHVDGGTFAASGWRRRLDDSWGL